MKFEELNLLPEILSALVNEGYEQPTLIQEQAIPLILKGRDLLGCAQTGTGKTAAFAIPILQLLHLEKQLALEKASVNSQTAVMPASNRLETVDAAEDAQTAKESSATKSKLKPLPSSYIRALILSPTRELALQTEESLLAYGKNLNLKTLAVYGGISQASQTAALKKGIDILVATPGRLLDLVNQRYINLRHIRLFVLDEADRMLDMGFAPDVKRISGLLPKIRQTMLFSATMPSEILHLVDNLLSDPEEISVTPVSSAVDSIDQYVYHISRINKRHLLVWLLKKPELKSVLVFCRTKFGAERICKELSGEGISVDAIHGDKSQTARQIALNQFKQKKVRVLVATDIAARGIDVEDISHVILLDLPDLPETYVHRIGRTGRAGSTGTAISFCDEEEKQNLRTIQKLTKSEIKVVYEHPFNTETQIAKPEVAVKKIPFSGGGVRRRGYGRGRSFG